MKKIKLNEALELNKEVVGKLQESQLQNTKGGLAQGISCLFASCNSKACEPDKS
tara:strand:- start:337 stop:498 length:162 start_codon:yes stop_codon:yes gene_type:complete